MRRVCTCYCPALTVCRAEVDAELASGRRVVGMRAGESARQRARRRNIAAAAVLVGTGVAGG